ncbi:MAG: hypothetical protein IT186_15935 [Acidobacteria bacterium]|nr:hypothetical protein [Acidobacteriota bacterium]
MTPSELVSAVRSLGAELVIRDWELRIRKPKLAPPELDSLLTLIREDREAVKATLSAIEMNAPACLDCRRLVTPNDLFCDTCFQARKIVPFEELTRRREERRQRTLARVTGVPCGTCGKVRWNVNARGDAFCLTCFEERRDAR